MSEVVFGTKGSRLPKDAVMVIANSKLKEFGKLIQMIEAGAPVTLNPRLEEAKFAVDLYSKLTGKKPDEAAIIRGFSRLPSSIGKVSVLETNLMIHLGIAYNKRTIGDKVKDIVGVRSKYVQKGDWEDLVDHVRCRKDEIPKSAKLVEFLGVDYDITTKHIARVVCPGWGVVGSEEHHECGVDRTVREPWHKLRCPECHKAFMKARNTYRGPIDGDDNYDDVLDLILGE